MSALDERRKNCEHKYQYGGLLYWHAEYPMPGTGAKARHYADWFYCEKCLDRRLENERVVGNSYDKPIEGAAPR